MRTKILIPTIILLGLWAVLPATPAAAQTGACPPNTGKVAVIPIGGVLNVCVQVDTSSTGGYNAIDPATGQPVVSSYDVILLNDGDPVTGTAQATINIGKPPLTPQGTVWAILPNASVPTGRRFRPTAVAKGQTTGTPPVTLVSGRAPLGDPFVVANPVAPAAPLGAAVPGS